MCTYIRTQPDDKISEDYANNLLKLRKNNVAVQSFKQCSKNTKAVLSYASFKPPSRVAEHLQNQACLASVKRGEEVGGLREFGE